MAADVDIWGTFEDRLTREMEDVAEKCRRALKRKKWIDKWAPELPDGVRIHMGAYDLFYNVTIEFPRELLPQMRQALGRCVCRGKDVCSGRDNTVYVFLEFPGVEGQELFTFRYVRKLPEGSKCRIVAQTTEREARTDYALVCEL
jgi:hypothetical protein